MSTTSALFRFFQNCATITDRGAFPISPAYIGVFRNEEAVVIAAWCKDPANHFHGVIMVTPVNPGESGVHVSNPKGDFLGVRNWSCLLREPVPRKFDVVCAIAPDQSNLIRVQFPEFYLDLDAPIIFSTVFPVGATPDPLRIDGLANVYTLPQTPAYMDKLRASANTFPVGVPNRVFAVAADKPTTAVTPVPVAAEPVLVAPVTPLEKLRFVGQTTCSLLDLKPGSKFFLRKSKVLVPCVVKTELVLSEKPTDFAMTGSFNASPCIAPVISFLVKFKSTYFANDRAYSTFDIIPTDDLKRAKMICDCLGLELDELTKVVAIAPGVFIDLTQ